jgi:hypothetical protein
MRFAELAPHELPAMDLVTGGDGRREPGLDEMVRRMRG